MCLDDLPESSTSVAESKQPEVSAEDMIKRNSELQTELEALAKQFNNYRLAVQQTLDTRWGEDDIETPNKAQAGSSKAQETKESGKDGNDYSESYFASYARNGMYLRSPKWELSI
jgi:protein arginine N-methyltransferase 3